MGFLHRGSAAALAVLLGGAGCSRANPRFGDGAASGDSGGQDDVTRTDGSGTTTTPGMDGSGGSGTRPDVPPDTTGTAVCGDGVLDPGEECDEAGDGCRPDCHRSGAEVWSVAYAPEPNRDHHFNGVARMGPDVVAVGQASDGGVPTTAIVRFAAKDGQLRDTIPFEVAGETEGEVWAVEAADTDLYIGASVMRPPGDGFDAAAASFWADPETGELTHQWTTAVPGGVTRAIAVQGDQLYAAVSRFNVGGYGLVSVGLADGILDEGYNWISVNSPGSGEFQALLRRGGQLLVGGRISANAVVGEAAAAEIDFMPWTDFPADGPRTGLVQALAEVGGDVLVAGWRELPNAARDAWIARYDSNGVEVWSTTIDGGSTDADEIQSIALDDNGDIIAVGGLGEPTLATITAFDADDGTLLWQRSYDLGGGEGFFRGVVIDKDIFVVGEHTPLNAMAREAIAMRLRP